MTMQNSLLNILIINRIAKDLEEPGHKRHAVIKSLMQDKNINVDIVCSDIDYIDNKKNFHANQNLIRLKCLISGENIFLRFFSHIEFSLRVLFFNATGYTHIIGTSPDLFNAFSAFLLAKKYKSKFLLEIRDIWPLSIKELISLPFYPGYSLLQRIESILYKNSKLIISTLANFGDYLEHNNFGKLQDKVIHIPQLTLTPIAKHNKKLPIENIKLIYSGSLRKNNHLIKIIKFIDRLNKSGGIQFCLSIVGYGPEKKQILSVLKNSDVEVKFYNPIKSGIELRDLIAKHHLGIAYLKDSRIYRYGVSLNKAVDFHTALVPLIILNQGDNIQNDKRRAIIFCQENEEVFTSIAEDILRSKEQEKIKNEIQAYFYEKNSSTKYINQLIKQIRSC